MAAGGKMIGEVGIEIEEIERPVPFLEFGDWINLLITTLPVLWYWRKYPKDRNGILKILLIILLWDLALFDFDLSAMEWLGL